MTILSILHRERVGLFIILFDDLGRFSPSVEIIIEVAMLGLGNNAIENIFPAHLYFLSKKMTKVVVRPPS